MLEDIETFRAIVLTGNFTKAAKVLGLSTPVVTRRLARLEEALNARLIQRSTRHIHLTEAGELFFKQISDVIEAFEASKEAVKNLNNEVSGTLKVGMPATISNLYVTKTLHVLKEKYPLLNIHIATGEHLLHLLANGFDLIIHAGTLPDSNFYFKKIGSWKKIFCASPTYLEKHGTPISPDELKLHECIDHLHNTERTWDYQENSIVKKMMINSKIRVDNNFAMRELALSGVGIACLSKCMINADLNAGNLVSILQQYETPAFTTYAVYPNNKFMSKKTVIFIDFITELLKSVYGEMNNDS